MGRSDLDPVICWHGFARTGTDFYALAQALSDRFFVICPDTPGRGLSQWLEPANYQFATYQRLALALMDRVSKGRPVAWVGTSMGGALGMMLAAHPLARGRIQRLVLNDIGPEVPLDAIERIRSYTGAIPVFSSYSEARAHFETVYSPFGELSETEWQRLLLFSLRRRSDGGLTVHYDPAILSHFGEPQNPTLAWTLFRSIGAPMLVIQGTDSDILTDRIATRMVEVGRNVQLVRVPNVGHAPFLNTTAQIAAISSFLTA